MDPDRQDSCRAFPAGGRLVAVPGASRRPARMAVSKGRLTLRCSQVFPVLFPVCSQSGSMNSMRSQCSGLLGTTHMDVVPSLIAIYSTAGNIGNTMSLLTTFGPLCSSDLAHLR